MGNEPPVGPQLRRLRTERGISLAELARLTHYSKGYLSKIETGTKPASADLARRLDETLDTGGHLAALLAAAEAPRCPYLGLAAFDTPDAGWFFGRDHANEELIEGVVLAVDNGKPVALVGPSGVGKSSLLRAGLLPALAGDALPGSGRWPAVVITPTAAPGTEFAKHVTPLLEAGTDARRIVVVVDQLEEVFTLCENETERTAFIDVLCGIAAGARALVVLGLRADFYERCLNYPRLLGALRRNQVTVGPMTVPELRTAITRPAEAAGLRLEPGLVELLLADVGARENGQGVGAALPLLSHALLATWQEREGETLTVDGYRRTGGIDNAVAETAERAYDSMDPVVRDAARRLLLRLVRVGEHEQDTRRLAEREPLLRQLADPVETETAMRALAAARLLTVDAETVRITHEALLRAWPRLRRWLDSDRSGLRVHQQLNEAAQTWDSEDRPTSLLQRGPRLELATDWAHEHDRQLSSVEREYLAASKAQEDLVRRRDRRHARRLRLLVAGLAAVTILAVVATVIAVRQSDLARHERDIAVSKALAVEANQLRMTDPELGRYLSLAAYRVADTPEARGSLLASSGTAHVTQLEAHPAALTDLTFTPDGHTLITAGEDGATRLWDLGTSGRPAARATITGNARQVTAMALTPRGHLLATADDPDAIRLWRIDRAGDPSPAGVIPGTGQGLALSFSHDGTLLAIAGTDGGVGVWNVADPAKPANLGTLTGHTGAVRSLAFAPNAPILVTGGDDHTSRLWDLGAALPRTPPAALSTHDATIRAVAFSPDGHLVATGSDDRGVELWTVTDPRRPVRVAVLSEHVNAVRGLAFSVDGRSIATTGDDQTVRLWNTADGNELMSLPQPAPARRAAFAAGGAVLATGDDLGGVWLWRLPAPVIAHRGEVTALAYRPRRPELAVADDRVRLWQIQDQGQRVEAANFSGSGAVIAALAHDPRGGVLAVADERSSRLWDVSNPAEPLVLTEFGRTGDETAAMAYSPDGRLLAVSDGDWAIHLWDTTDPAAPVAAGVLSGHRNAIRALAFSPDGKLLASASNDYDTRLWDVTNPRAPGAVGTFTDHRNAVSGVAFSPDGRVLATASEDHTVHLLDLANPTRPGIVSTLTGHADAVNAVAFSPNGTLLATAGEDHTARLWDVTDVTKPIGLAALTGHADVVNAVAFSPDGLVLATGGDDRTVRLWQTDPTAIAHRICEDDRPPLSREQWSRYVPEVPFQPLCG